MKKTNMRCVDCGHTNATEGEMRHPYCKKCFKKRFKDYKGYELFVGEIHD